MAFASLLSLAFQYKAGENRSNGKEELLKKGDSIATVAQQQLMKNVMKAIKEKGFAGAVEFCSEKAIPLTDSSAATFKVQISRVTDRNRNPNNNLKSEQDFKAWELIKSMTNKDKHLITQSDDGIYYYKAINLTIPTCLSCHGDKSLDIAPETLAKINEKYPKDKATGYKMGELRGMWKIKIN